MNQSFSIVATPIGNRDDMTTRAIQVLGDVDFIVAEDTRHTGQLMAFYGIKKPMISFRDAPKNVMDRSLSQIRQRLENGESGAYVTDAGTPSVSDPGWRLVEMVLNHEIPITPIPGASAVTTLVSLVHVPLDEYRFVGFLPKKKGYQSTIDELTGYLTAKENRAVVFYESPRRIRKTLTDFASKSPKLQAIIGRELTKKFETIYRVSLKADTVKELPDKGEYVVLLHS
jgi:16S rRNA (cytidine1402-2'-O)-methyltransferase